MEQFFGKYQVKREIGRGAMGSVYLAFDPVLERDLAIKTISSSIREEHLKERFIREAKAAGKLTHNNIVTIYDFGVENDRLFIAMEYLEGVDLYQMIAERQNVDIKTKLTIILQICRGLAYAHDHEVYHRDIKPANIRILKDGSVKIVDFGLAVMQTSSLTQSGAFLGTPNYVAPERLKGVSGTASSDQFAVGILFYELLTYSRAFTGENISTVIFSVLNHEPQALDPGLLSKYPELGTIVRKSIMKDPEQRYASLKLMADDIDALIEKMKRDQFSMTGPVPVISDRMDSEMVEPGTDHIIQTELSSVIPDPKKRVPVLVPVVSAVLLLVLAIVYFVVLAPKGAVVTDPSAATSPGVLAFDVKPYVSIQHIRDLKTGEQIALDLQGDGALTPLQMRLAPGKYEIAYSHPSLKGETRTKVVTVAAGENLSTVDYLEDSFAAEATKHFSLPVLIKEK